MAIGINDWLVKGTGIAKEAFEQLGITQEQIIATNGDLFAQFQLAADGLNKLEAGVEKTAIAYKLFGGRNIEKSQVKYIFHLSSSVLEFSC